MSITKAFPASELGRFAPARFIDEDGTIKILRDRPFTSLSVPEIQQTYGMATSRIVRATAAVELAIRAKAAWEASRLPRRRKDNPRDLRLRVRVSREEKAAIEAKAEEAGLSVSGWLRALAAREQLGGHDG